jgi:hypothetical protein
MNERIKLLAEQAEKYADYNFKGENFWSEAYESKFAELIVLECAELFDKDEIELTLTERTIHSMIKEHFGVKE